ncbi:unnamed protein product [Gemmataceae bacterium]|nr:unnamed protein product [Gemmataceae bacterium]VTT99430.1 unnamed protein product [Gemmataceae bacterium]
MPATTCLPALCRRFRRVALAVPVVLFALVAPTARGLQPDPKKSADPKTKDSPVVRLPDGTYLWVGSSTDSAGERVSLTPQELQKLLNELDQVRKQLAARKPAPPSGCAVRGRVEKRGEQLVAALRLTCTFRTTAPQTAVALGGRRGFLVAAALDGNKLPVLDTNEDGFALMVEAAGDHSLVLDLEAPVTSRGAKPELGFEIGLPRAAITTLLFDPPGQDVKRVNLTTKTVDPAQPARPPETRRTPALELKQLAARAGHEAGYPLGPVDSVEVTWDPPAAAAQPADQVQSADLDVAVLLTEPFVETTAKVRFRGPAREWKLVAPATADVTADHAAGPDTGPTQPATVSRPGDPNKPVWKIEFPAGSPATDWTVTVVTRQPRPRPEDPQHRGPYPVGPFTTLDVLRQTGTVKVTAAANTQLTFKHGPDLRKAEPPGPADEEVTTAFFRLVTGPSGSSASNAPLFTLEARPQVGAVKVKPTYRLSLTDTGWRVRAEVRVFPIRTQVESVLVEVPVNWRGLEASPPELVEGVQQVPPQDGFWAASAAQAVGGRRVSVVVRLAAAHKQPFDLVLTGTVPVEPGDAAGTVALPRFPEATESAATLTATVPDGFELRAETRDWDGEYAAWGTPLGAVADPSGKGSRAVTTVSGQAESGFARVTLGWSPHHPDLAAEVRADVTLGERQLVIVQQIKLRSSTGLPRRLRFRGPAAPAAMKTVPALDPVGTGEWVFATAPDATEVTVSATYATALPRQSPGVNGAARVPVALLWPVGATRTEATARVWTDLDTSRAVTSASSGWRELAVEPAPDRDALPVLTLSAVAAEPLTLETQPVADTGTVAVWAERGLVQAWGGDDGTVSYRARYLLRRWLRPSVEVRLPSPLAGPNPEFFRDGQRLDAVALTGTDDERAFRVPLPAARPGATTVVEVRYQLPVSRGPTGELVYFPPTLPGVAFVGPVQWQAVVAHGHTPLVSAGASTEFRWRPRPTGVAPCAAGSAEALEAWFRTGDDAADASDAPGEVFVARQVAPGPVRVYQVHHTGLVVVCSAAAFILVLVLWRLPGAVFGLGVAAASAAAVVAAIYYPHPAAQVAGACQPGVVAAAGVAALAAAARWLHRRRLARMPGFSRTSPEPSAQRVVLPSSARNRPNPDGTASFDPAPPIKG